MHADLTVSTQVTVVTEVGMLMFQVYQMLKQWRERDGEEAYAEVLEQALLDCGMTDAAIVMTSY